MYNCTDVIACPDNNLAQQEKLRVQRYSRQAVRTNPNEWLKQPKNGGFTSAKRQLYYAQLVSRARQEFLSEHSAEIWKRHHEVGFILVFDGSEDRLLRFRDGKWPQFDLTDLSSQSITLL